MQHPNIRRIRPTMPTPVPLSALRGRPLLAEPGHGAVEVMQIEVYAASDTMLLAPAIGGEVRAAAHQPVRDGEEYRVFQCEAMATAACQRGDRALTAALRPQVFEYRGRTDRAGAPAIVGPRRRCTDVIPSPRFIFPVIRRR